MKKKRILMRLAALLVAIVCFTLILPKNAGAWKTKTHGYSANLLLNEVVDKGYFTIDGEKYAVPDEFIDALLSYPAAFRAGVLGPDFYPDMLTGQSYIHPYDAEAGIGVGDWLMELVDAVNSLPKDHKERKRALAFTLGMAVHYAGDLFGHDFINAFAGGAYPAYAEAAQDKNKLFFIIRHMAEESYMDSLIGGRLGSTNVSAPETFIMNTWIYEGTANNGPASIYSNYDGGMMYQYKYLVEMRAKLYAYAEKNRESITPPMPQIVQYLDSWIEDLDNATYQLIVAFDDIAHDFLTGANGKSDIQIVTDRLDKWLDDYGKYASPAPDILTDISKAFNKSKDWVLKELGLSYITEAWKQFKNELIQDMILWGLAQAGIDYKQYADLLKDPELALEANGGSVADYEEFITYMDTFDKNYEEMDAFYNTLLMGKLILIGPDNLNRFFKKYGVSSSFTGATGHVMMDEFDIEIHTKDGSIFTTYGTDDNVFVDVYEDGKKICTKLLDKSGYDDFERNDRDTYRVSLPHQISPDEFSLSLRIQKISDVEADPDEWTIDDVSVACRCSGFYIFGKTYTTQIAGQTITFDTTGEIDVFDGEHTFKKWGSKLNLDPKISSSSLTYTTELNPTIISFMKSNDNSTQWVNDDNILWSNMTARRNILYEVFHGFKPTIYISASKTSFKYGTEVYLTADFSSYWNGITKERRDKEYIVESVGETKQKACSGIVTVMDVSSGERPVLTGNVTDGKASINLAQLTPGKYMLRVDYAGDEFNGSAKSNVIEVNVDSPQYTVTFQVKNGAWNDGTTTDKKVVVTGSQLPLYLSGDQIPAVGNNPNDTFKAGSWNTTVKDGTQINENTTFVYTYAKKDTISQVVTFKVENGAWDDGSAEDITVILNGYEGDILKLNDSQIPTAGTKPDDTYKAGSWDVAPVADVEITGNPTYTYTYAKKDTISQVVTFNVENGAWDDGSADDITVILNGYEGDILKLDDSQIPTAGTKPDDTYKAGSWDVTPAADVEITGNPTYTYTYAKKETISQVVTFKVENGAWDDGSTDDIIITLNGYEDDKLKLDELQIPAAGTKPDDTFKAGTWDVEPVANVEITGNPTYTYTYAKKATITQVVTFKVENGAWDDGSTDDIIINLSGYEDEILKLEDSQIPAAGKKPDDTFKAGSWDVSPVADVEITGNPTYTYTYAKKGTISQVVTFKVENGAWDDGSTDDIIVNLSGYEDEILKLVDSQIPAAGTKPDDTFKAGSWDVTPVANAEVTGNPTYTYTYAKKATITQVVTFKVENGAWDDGSTDEIIINLSGYEDEILKLDDSQIPTAGTKPDDTFKAGAWDASPVADVEITGNPTYTYTYAKKATITQVVTFKVENGAWDDGSTDDIIINLSGYEDEILKLDDSQIPTAGTKPDNTYKEGSWDVAPVANVEITGNPTYTYTYAMKERYVVRFDTDGGTQIESVTVFSGDSVDAPKDPEKKSFVFTGWFADENFSTPYDFSAGIFADTTIYASWEQVNYIAYGNTEFRNGTDEEVVITVKRSYADETCFSHFSGVTIDGKALASETDYTAAPGSTIITMKLSALQALTDGEHKMTILFDDGQTDVTLTVTSRVPIPQTGDNENLVICFTLILTGTALILAIKKRREMIF